MRRLVITLLAVLAACASPGSLEKGDKGGLVSVKVDERALSTAYAPRRLALLVGVSQFQDAQWRDLRYATKDAEDLGAALRDPARGHFDSVRVLSRPEETTRASILAALRQLRQEATRPDDVVVVYFSAHGTLSRDGRGELKRYLVTTDASFRAIAQTALPMDELKSEFDQLPSRRRLMVLATCHSGSGKSLLPKELEAELAGIKAGFYARPLEESSRASMVFAACDWGETAREDEGLQNDIYTHFLIDGLNGAADRNSDGAVTATEAHDHARRSTYAFTQGRQRPSAEILEVGADPVVLSGHIDRTGRPELFSYNPRLDGFTLKVDGETRTELPGGAAVPPGRRTVELTKGEDVLLREVVDISVGERLPLERLLSETFPRRSLSLMGGMFSFVDARSRNELLPASPELALVLRLEERPLPDLSLVFDLSGGRGRQNLHLAPGTSVPFTYTSLSMGAAVPYTWRWEHLSLYAGPRVAALFLQRSFQTEAFTGGQQYFTVSPGVVGGVVWRLGERLELSAQTQLMVTYVVVDGQGQAVGFSGGWAGVGYRF
ncbi:putative caspase-like protein [Archangium gephyra]|uniref:Caspase-like protein n=1 Tax=Archangium gephyra TaxID=48 RepID=A0ABX9JX30_9BACT|nr:caspase family protein [Archangium gephyra]REG28775.1 putative caspase-like protein [Archangium gephyra]